LVALVGGLHSSLAAARLRFCHLSGRVAKARADLVELKLDRRTLLALAGLERPLTQSPLSDDAHPLREGASDVLGELTPDARAQEQRLAVLPLAGLPVKGARGGGDGEVRDGESRLRVAQLRIGG